MAFKLISTLFEQAFFGSLMTRGAIFAPHPLTIGGNEWKFQKLSWNLILTEIDARQKDLQLSDT